MNNVRYEIELYEPMCQWLEQKLKDTYKGKKCEIIVKDSHSVTLDKILEEYGLIDNYPQAVGVDIQIDVIEYRFAVKRHAKVLQADQLFGHVSSPVS